MLHTFLSSTFAGRVCHVFPFIMALPRRLTSTSRARRGIAARRDKSPEAYAEQRAWWTLLLMGGTVAPQYWHLGGDPSLIFVKLH
jgi:hypothetical protein